jgi:hypothetical protein
LAGSGLWAQGAPLSDGTLLFIFHKAVKLKRINRSNDPIRKLKYAGAARVRKWLQLALEINIFAG